MDGELSCYYYIDLPPSGHNAMSALQCEADMHYKLFKKIKVPQYHYKERIEKKCFVWKHKVHVIDPGILLWALLRRDWLTERGTSAADKSRTAYTVARPESPSVFLTSVNAVVNFGALRYFYL